MIRAACGVIEDGSAAPRPVVAAPLAALPPAPDAASSAAEDASGELSKRHRLKDEHTLRELRICLSSILHELHREKRYAPFWRPVDPEENPEYYELCGEPVDLETIRTRVDAGHYLTLAAFLRDVELIKSNAEDFNPRAVKGARGRDALHNACHLIDSIHSHVYKLTQEVGHVFRRCEKIAADREKQLLEPAESKPIPVFSRAMPPGPLPAEHLEAPAAKRLRSGSIDSASSDTGAAKDLPTFAGDLQEEEDAPPPCAEVGT